MLTSAEKTQESHSNGDSIAENHTSETSASSLPPPPLQLKSDMTSNSTQVIQAKKSDAFDYATQCRANRIGLKYADYKDFEGDARSQRINELVTATYDSCLAKGTRYWDGLQDKIATYNSEDSEELIEGLTEKRASYDKRFKSNYSTRKTAENEEGFKTLTSWGKEKFFSKKNPTADYANHFNVEEGIIEAAHNYATADKARIRDAENADTEGYSKRGLPNSEVIWQQYKSAAMPNSGKNRDGRAVEAMQALSKISRVQVANASTQQTAYKALPDGKSDWTSAHTWDAGSEEFLALLGTPNCSGAAFMLSDHVDQLDGKNINNISLIPDDRDLKLDINFTP